MRQLRDGVRLTGWAALMILAVTVAGLGHWRGLLEPGGWSISLLALCLVSALVAPSAFWRALPVAALAVLLGAFLFSVLPEQTDLKPVETLLMGTAGAAALVALPGYAGRQDVAVLAEALLAGALHAGLLQVLTVAPMAAPSAIWPWFAPVLLAVWAIAAALVLGLGRFVTGRSRRASARHSA